jgi:Zn-dependent protease with chaperone function
MSASTDFEVPFQAVFESGEVPDELIERSEAVTIAALKGLTEMGVSNDLLSRVEVHFCLHQILPSPSVRLENEKIVLDIPLLFLLSREDMNPTSKIGIWAQTFFSGKVLSKEAKKFVLYHELAHIFYGHIFRHSCTSLESKESEKAADLKALEVLRTAVGGIYLFNILAKFDKRETATHPSFEERVSYLQEEKIVEIVA